MPGRPIRTTRRHLLKAAAATLAAPMFVPARVLGENSPSNTLRIGSIGTGRMGHGDMQECLYRGLDPKLSARIVAVCDVDANRAAHAAQTVQKIYREKLPDAPTPEVAIFGDYRELLQRPDIDGVTISTPDHWHALNAIAAVNAGKDVYIQKPLTYSVAEGQALVKAVRRKGRVLQTGSQQRSSVYFRMACELVRNGRLGTLKEILVTLPTDRGTGRTQTMPVPENLNYDMWLGPTAEMPYTEDRVHPKSGFGRPGWLQIEAYCRGMITGWGAHMFDIAQWGHDSDDSGPVEMTAVAEFPDRGLFDVHTEFKAEGRYASGVVLRAESGAAGVKFIGERGSIFVTRGKITSDPPEILRQKVGDGETRLEVSENHMANFLACMRSRKDPICPVEVGHRSNTVCVITHIAMKLGRRLQWDPIAERFVNDDAANALLDYPHRKPWVV